MEQCEMELRVGGKWRYRMHGRNEDDTAGGLAIYREIQSPEKIVYRDHFTDADGNVAENMTALMVTVEFTAHNEKTRQVMTVDFDTDEDRDKVVEMGMAEGMDSSL